MTQNVQNVDGRLSALETRVDGIIGTLQTVAAAVGNLGEKMDKRSQPNWSVYISGFTAMLTVLGLIGMSWKAPIETSIAGITSDVARMQTDYIPRWVHEREWSRDEREREAMRARITRAEDAAAKRLERLEADRFKGN